MPKLLQPMKLNKYKIKNRILIKMRNKVRAFIENDLQTMIEQKDKNDKGPYPKIQFMNKFVLSGALCKFYEEDNN